MVYYRTMTRIVVFCLLFVFLILPFSACAPAPEKPPPLPPPPSPPTLPIVTPDTTPPETIIIDAPSGKVDYRTIKFNWTGSDDRTSVADLVYSCYLQGCDSSYTEFGSLTAKTYTNLPDGNYTFYVRAKDASGNIDPTPASISFTIAATPSVEPPKRTPGTMALLIAPGSEVSRIAIGNDSNTIYALDAKNARLFKSIYSGYGWKDISKNIAGAATWNELAIAPDNSDLLAVVTDSRTEVYTSQDGGATFFATGLAAKLKTGERVRCLTLSPAYDSSKRDLIVGTSTGSAGGRVWIMPLVPFGTGWKDVSTGASGWLPTTPAIKGADVFAVKCSPNFGGDRTILAIVASGSPPDTDDTYLYMGIRDFTANTVIWNSLAGYPVEICQPGEDTPGTPLTYADLALPFDYSSAMPTLSQVYACWSDNPRGVAISGNNNDDVYRIDGNRCCRLYSGRDVICSLAYYGTIGRGKLMAGAMMSQIVDSPATQVYFTSSAHSSRPTWQSSLKSPTGKYEAMVAWAPDGKTAYCGTSGGSSYDQSAFSRSLNDGLTWNQIGLIDT